MWLTYDSLMTQRLWVKWSRVKLEYFAHNKCYKWIWKWIHFKAASQAAQAPPGQAYFVLLILTDGAITDFAETKDAIVRASPYPLSIIIVGVGNADFSAMDDLDSDGKLIKERVKTSFMNL